MHSRRPASSGLQLLRTEHPKAPHGADAAVDDQSISDCASHSSSGGLLLTGPLQLLASTPHKFLAGGESSGARSASGANSANVGSSLNACTHAGMPLANATAAEASPWRQICKVSQQVNVDQHSPALCHAERFQQVRSESAPCCDFEVSEDETEMPMRLPLDPGTHRELSGHDSISKANNEESEPVRDSKGGSYEPGASSPMQATGNFLSGSTCDFFLASHDTTWTLDQPDWRHCHISTYQQTDCTNSCRSTLNGASFSGTQGRALDCSATGKATAQENMNAATSGHKGPMPESVLFSVRCETVASCGEKLHQSHFPPEIVTAGDCRHNLCTQWEW